MGNEPQDILSSVVGGPKIEPYIPLNFKLSRIEFNSTSVQKFQDFQLTKKKKYWLILSITRFWSGRRLHKIHGLVDGESDKVAKGAEGNSVSCLYFFRGFLSTYFVVAFFKKRFLPTIVDSLESDGLLDRWLCDITPWLF